MSDREVAMKWPWRGQKGSNVDVENYLANKIKKLYDVHVPVHVHHYMYVHIAVQKIAKALKR